MIKKMISKLFKSRRQMYEDAINNLSVGFNRQLQKSVTLSMEILSLKDEMKDLKDNNTVLKLVNAQLKDQVEETENELVMLAEDYYEILDELESFYGEEDEMLDFIEVDEDLEDLEIESEKFYEDYGTPPYYQDI